MSPLSVVQVEPNVVVRERTTGGERLQRDGASAPRALKKSRTPKPYAGQFPQGTDPTRFLLEFKDFEKECKVGDKLGVEIFEGVRFVDVRGHHEGQGIPGRRAAPRVRGRARARTGPSSTGRWAPSGTGAFRKIVKGSRMPGKMGDARLTVQNLRLFRVDKEKGLLLINGSHPRAARRHGRRAQGRARSRQRQI